MEAGSDECPMQTVFQQACGKAGGTEIRGVHRHSGRKKHVDTLGSSSAKSRGLP